MLITVGMTGIWWCDVTVCSTVHRDWPDSSCYLQTSPTLLTLELSISPDKVREISNLTKSWETTTTEYSWVTDWALCQLTNWHTSLVTHPLEYTVENLDNWISTPLRGDDQPCGFLGWGVVDLAESQALFAHGCYEVYTHVHSVMLAIESHSLHSSCKARAFLFTCLFHSCSFVLLLVHPIVSRLCMSIQSQLWLRLHMPKVMCTDTLAYHGVPLPTCCWIPTCHWVCGLMTTCFHSIARLVWLVIAQLYLTSMHWWINNQLLFES